MPRTARREPVVEATERMLDMPAAAIVLAAASNGAGFASNIRGDEAALMPDGRVRLSLKGRDGHSRSLVRVPELVMFYDVEPIA